MEMKRSPKTTWLTLIFAGLLALMNADCGKKGPPIPPDEPPEQESPYPANRPDRGDRR